VQAVPAIIGALVGVVVEFASPWSEVIMASIQNTLANESVHNYPGLPLLISLLGILVAYLMLPSIGAGIGFALGSDQ
jgi:hypothetical protein